MIPASVVRCVVAAVGLCLLCTGCEGKKTAAAAGMGGGPPEVSVSVPVEREVVESVVFTGQTEAVDSVEIRARVSGYLTKVLFKAGSEVKVGDPLFEIDPRPYQSEVDRIQGELDGAQSRLKRLEADLKRSEDLFKKKIITPEEYEKVVADRDETVAAIRSREASLETAKLDLSFSSITAPIAGRVSREQISVGNLVSTDTTLLTDIVSQDPIYVYFDMDEQTLLRVKKMTRDKQLKTLDESQPPIELGLADEEGYPHQGVIDFAENKLTAGTGTIRVRGKFPNEDRALVPGMFCRVLLKLGAPRAALLVPERAIGSDQQRKFVLVVGPDDTVESRTVTLGRLEGHLRVIENGLKAGERVIVNGLQRARSGVKVKTMTVDPLTLSDTRTAGAKEGGKPAGPEGPAGEGEKKGDKQAEEAGK